jgi:uncharacterized GH25 family protein
MIRIRLGAAAVAAMLSAGAAQAHSPYLLPNMFDATGRDHVTVQASFTEHAFTPDVVMKSDSFQVRGPDGATTPLTPTYFKDLAILEADTKADGTWRIGSGVRIGRMSKVAQVKGEWVFLEPDKPAPAGAVVGEMQSITNAEVYVSRGAPNATALAPTGKGVEFHALTHPNSIFAGQAAQFQALLDGKPLPDQTITVHRAGEDMDGGKPLEVKSDKDGRFAIKVDRPGVFLAMTRHRIGPADGKPGRSLTYALTFEAAE